jgi:hypothetical protein
LKWFKNADLKNGKQKKAITFKSYRDIWQFSKASNFTGLFPLSVFLLLLHIRVYAFFFMTLAAS